MIPAATAGCATQGKPPPTISLDEPVQAQPLPEPSAPVEVVAVPEVLPMPAQLKPLPEAEDAKPTPEPADEKVRVSRASRGARRTHARGIRQRDSGVAVHRWRALTSLCSRGPRDRDFAPAGRGAGDGGRW
ncbi:hypothetical protein J4732_13050 [Serratia marcescens]|uniref:Uncharacterized protein n=1 Tax=Serratia marcescens TaxID=615 RepID=A0A939NK38_SERMA|nr:hypothetical protein [Serratia marcescens]